MQLSAVHTPAELFAATDARRVVRGAHADGEISVKRLRSCRLASTSGAGLTARTTCRVRAAAHRTAEISCAARSASTISTSRFNSRQPASMRDAAVEPRAESGGCRQASRRNMASRWQQAIERSSWTEPRPRSRLEGERLDLDEFDGVASRRGDARERRHRLRGDAKTVDVTVTASLLPVVADGAERHRRITRGRVDATARLTGSLFEPATRSRQAADR